MTNLSDYKQYYYPAAATAEAWHIQSGKTAYLPAGKVTGTGYFPAMMQWDGVTNTHWVKSYTSSGNLFTFVARFKFPTFTGDVLEYITAFGNASGDARLNAAFISTNYTGLPNRQGRIQLWGQTSAGGAATFTLLSNTGYLDNEVHTMHCCFNSTTGAYVWKIDGVDAEDTGNPDKVAFHTYTMPSGAASIFTVGNDLSGGLAKQIGYCGMRDAYLTNWSDFMQTDGTPKPLDESTWTEWGAQPLFWNEHGDMVNNLGSAGAMTKTGTINVSMP